MRRLVLVSLLIGGCVAPLDLSLAPVSVSASTAPTPTPQIIYVSATATSTSAPTATPAPVATATLAPTPTPTLRPTPTTPPDLCPGLRDAYNARFNDIYTRLGQAQLESHQRYIGRAGGYAAAADQALAQQAAEAEAALKEQVNQAAGHDCGF